jgi:hypothetical protein
MRRLRGGTAAAVVLVFAVAGCKAETKTGSGAPQETGGSGAALTAAESLTVKGRAPKTGYSRERFGAAWADTDSNSCDTRDDILKRDLRDVKFSGGTCKVSYGVLESDPYSGDEVTYRRGRSLVDIDHLVALSDAWQKGAQKLTATRRRELANDPLNLLAAAGRANMSKGDGDAATWLPPNRTFRCAYVARQVAVKAKYDLWMTAAEKVAVANVLASCPGQPLPTATGSAVPAPLL